MGFFDWLSDNGDIAFLLGMVLIVIVGIVCGTVYGIVELFVQC